MTDKYILKTDGSYHEPTSTIGLGGVLYKNGEQLETFSNKILNYDLQFHEVTALLYGLRMAKRYGVQELLCQSDDEPLMLILNDPNRRYANERLLTFEHFKELTDLIESFNKIEFSHIPRKENKLADSLASFYRQTITKKYSTKKQYNDMIISKVNYQSVNDSFENQKKIIDNHIYFNLQANGDDLSIVIKTFNKSTQTQSENTINVKDKFVFIIEEITKVFNTYSGNLSFYIEGRHAQDITNIFKGTKKIGKNIEDVYLDLKDSMSRYNTVILYADPVFEPIEKPRLKLKRADEEDIIDCIKVLGEDSYQIGQRPDIENAFHLKPGQQGKIEVIQKLFLTHFIKMGVAATANFENMSAEEKSQYMESRKETLVKKGIKLRI